jgi:AraC-like DNA-binding protein
MAADDHFVAFLDLLQADLESGEDHGLHDDAAALAARAYLSRFHFERVVSAVAGETPTRFRGRILMERAGYRMIATDATLLDIALEAGFSSHEAFTRAFRREHGVTPSAWRRRPGSFRIEAPSDVHFHPPGGLRLPARHRMDSVDLVVEMVEHHVWLVGELVDRAHALSDADLDTPLPGPVPDIDGDTLRWALSRLIGQMAMWNAAVADATYDFGLEVDEPAAAMRRRLDVTGPDFVANVRRFADEGRFDETFVDAFAPRPVVLTYGAMVAHVLTFAAHHRLLAVAALRGLGVEDLGFGDPKQWFEVDR